MNILIIEDSKTIGSIMYRILHAYGFIPHLTNSAQRITSLLTTYHPQIILLNTYLQHADTSVLCKEIRTLDKHAFILGIHTKGPWQSRVSILTSGADDCISFPFPGQELIARINALLRRPRISLQPTLKAGRVTVIPDERKAFVDKHPIDLSRTEYHLLEYLTKNAGRVVSRAELLDHVWDYSRIINSNTVDVHIQKLRKKMCRNKTSTENIKKTKKGLQQNDSDSSYVGENFTSMNSNKKTEISSPIKTIHGIGYRLEGNLTVTKPQS